LWCEKPEPVSSDIALELLALLGPDLGNAGEQFLRRMAAMPRIDSAISGVSGRNGRLL
jgi:hypothetical protein